MDDRVVVSRLRRLPWPVGVALGLLLSLLGVILMLRPFTSLSVLVVVVGVVAIATGWGLITSLGWLKRMVGLGWIVGGVVVAVVFGARTVLFGLRLAWTAFHDRRTSRLIPSTPREQRSWTRARSAGPISH